MDGTTTFRYLVEVELQRARMKHSQPIHSKHEGYAVILEELDEVKQEVFHGKSRLSLTDELVQVAAMCQRMAEDLRLVGYPSVTGFIPGEE